MSHGSEQRILILINLFKLLYLLLIVNILQLNQNAFFVIPKKLADSDFKAIIIDIAKDLFNKWIVSKILICSKHFLVNQIIRVLIFFLLNEITNRVRQRFFLINGHSFKKLLQIPTRLQIINLFPEVIYLIQCPHLLFKHG